MIQKRGKSSYVVIKIRVNLIQLAVSTPTAIALSEVAAAAYGTSGIIGSPPYGGFDSDTAKGLLIWAAPESISMEALGGDAG